MAGSDLLLHLQQQMRCHSLTPQVRTPQLIDRMSFQKELVVLYEWIKVSSNTGTVSQKQLGRWYNAVLDYLHAATQVMTSDEWSKVVKRSGWQLGLIYPVWWIFAFCRRSDLRRQLLYSLPAWMGSVLFLLRMPASHLAHRDLHEGNLVYDRETLWLIDLEYIVVTVPGYDLVDLITYHYTQQVLRHQLMTRIDSLQETLHARFLRALGLYTTTLRLAASQLEPGKSKGLGEAMSFWMMYDSKQQPSET